MRVGASGLAGLLAQNVVEIKFRRRRFKPAWPGVRRMLCTNDLRLLNSMPGHLALNFERPTHPPPYAATPKNLVCAWDIMWQSYRMISCDDVNVITVIPTATPEDTKKFWDYFANYLSQMTASQKEAFMKS